jgi:hypothetical protein
MKKMWRRKAVSKQDATAGNTHAKSLGNDQDTEETI